MALFTLRKYPVTAKYEAEQEDIKTNYQRFIAYTHSDELKRIKELEILINTSDFKKKVETLKKERFKDTAAYRQLKKYHTQKKSSELKRYFKYQASGMAQKVEEIAKSDKLKELADLNEYIRSSEFNSAKQQKGFKKTEAFQKLKRHKALKKDKDIKLYNKQVNSSNYKNYQHIHNSERLKQFHELEKEVSAEKFIAFKKEMEDKKRFQKSEEYSLIQEYQKLLKSPDYNWYLKTEKRNNFGDIAQWELCFDDNFETKQLNKEKWITAYYWGKALLNKTYVLDNERQFFKDTNICINGGGAQISTKNEKVAGLAWTTQHGFVPKEFDFTSGLISTGQSHRQLYGKFEAKVKVNQVQPVQHAFWMVGEKMAPQIDIFRFEDANAKSFTAGTQLLNGKGAERISKTVTGASFDKGYYIYSLEWTQDRISWFINGVKVNEQTQNIPSSPMYIVFSSHLTEDVEQLKDDPSMTLEWVRCYRIKN
ncbi:MULTISPECIES: glycoside hydrolase family 16 protein [unclassified Carboxylicivirga]|uniref:glycoside hydrolase family 16 protein n=1 Tax=Carboxylicivirga TaxID=1628153 RepID=UPI003D351A9A